MLPPPQPLQRSARRKHGRPLLIGLVAFSALLVSAVVTYFVLGAAGLLRHFTVTSGSMAPTLVKGDSVFMDGWTYHRRLPQRGELALYRTDDLPRLAPGQIFIHRIVGLPGEKLAIKGGTLLVNGQPVPVRNEQGPIVFEPLPPQIGHFLVAEDESVTVPENSFFVVGDNVHNSFDSRAWGFLSREAMVGRACLRWRGRVFTSLP